MESTSAYWKGVLWLLEAEGFDCWLVNARDVKNVPGRPKTDKADAVWLAKVAERGMCRPSLVHPRPIRQLRDLTRSRRSLIQDRTRELQRVEQAAGRRPDQAQLGRHRHLRGLGAGDAGDAGGRPA
jgi:transposase